MNNSPWRRLTIAALFVISTAVHAADTTQGAAVAFKAADAVIGQAPTPRAAGSDDDIALPPAWAFGVLYGNYCDQPELLQRMQRLLGDDYPVDALWVDSAFWDVSTHGPKGYLNFRGDPAGFPDVKGLCDTLEREGIRFGVWVWDRISDAEPEVYREFEQRGLFKGAPLAGNGWHNKNLTGTSRFIDFNNPAARALWQEKMQPLMDAGLDFFKLDAGPAGGYLQTCFELTQRGRQSRGRGFIMSHVGRASVQLMKKYPTAWTGDNLPAWHHAEFPDPVRWIWGGLQEQLRMVADPQFGYYDFPFLTNDTGGFRNIPGHGRASDELYMRWVQFSAFGAIMEVFGSMTFPGQNQPWTFSPAAQENFRRYTHLRMQLFPYLYSYAHLTRQTSRKMIQGEAAHPFQYQLGHEFLVAPVFVEGAREREVWLPEGNDWIDYWTGTRSRGGRSVTVSAPVDRLPLFVRAGAIVPTREYARTVERGSNRVLQLEIWPQRTSHFSLFEDDGLSEGYRSGGIAITEIACIEDGGVTRVQIAPARGHYAGEITERTWRFRIHRGAKPARVSIGSQELPGWTYDAASRVVQGEFTSPTAKGFELELRE